MDTDDFTGKHFRLLLDDNPGWKATEILFDDFLRFLLLYPHQQQVFELLEKYEEICSDQVLILRKVIQRGAPGAQKFARTVEMLRFMEAELWTWRLMRLFFADRFEKAPHRKNLNDDELRALSDMQKWDYLHDTNRTFREMRLIVRWCQQNAADLLGDQGDLEFFVDKTNLWGNTLHCLKTDEDTAIRKNYIKNMDPDANVRGNFRLDDSDNADEQRFLRQIFAFVRAGQLDKAIDLCAHCGQSWRAATLKGFLPYHKSDQKSEKSLVGNSSRDVWKRAAWKFCDNAQLSVVERAIYGALSGHFMSVSSLCSSWEDSLWAYAIAASEFMYDSFSRRTSKRQMIDLAPTSTINEQADYTIEDILQELEASSNEKIRMEAQTVFRRLHSFIITNQPDAAVRFAHQYLSDLGVSAPKHLVRILAHVILIFKLFGVEITTSFANGILEHYVGVLIEDKRTEIIAYYVSTLPVGLQPFWYAKLLENVEEKDERVYLLSLAEKAGLDVRSICLTVVDNIHQTFQPSLSRLQDLLSPEVSVGSVDDSAIVKSFTSTTVTESDARVISAVEWLLFDPGLRLEAVRHANLMARMFLIGRNLTAVKHLFDVMPSDSLDIAARFNLEDRDDGTDAYRLRVMESENSIREYLCHRAYLEAHEAFSLWFEYYHRKRPQKFAPGTATSFQQRAVNELKMKQYEENLAMWETNLQKYTDAAISAIHNVLSFPEGGWMVDKETTVQRDDSMDDELDRRHELTLIRKQCLPLAVDMLVSVLHTSGRFREAMKVADLVASEETQLYKVFSKDHLRHLLRRLSSSSVEALDNKFDFLGFGNT